MKKIVDELKKKQDKKYGEFQAKLIPTVDKKTIIGVRTPELKKMAREFLKCSQCVALTKVSRSVAPTKGLPNDVEKFLDELPHKYFDENQLHVFILSEMKNFDICIKRVNEFLPYINNWATCDQLSPKCFKKNKDVLIKYINKWIKSIKAYVVRFAIEMLMSYFLDDDFDKKYLKMVADIKFLPRVSRPYKGLNLVYNTKGSQCFAPTNGSQCVAPTKGISKSMLVKSGRTENISVDIDPDKYYVEMMRAWYFATALAKQYDATFPYIKNKRLNAWTHNKTIQKACESFRVSEAHKKQLKIFKI